MKKILSLILALALVCLCFAACQGGEESSQESDVSQDGSSAPSIVTDGKTYKVGLLLPPSTKEWGWSGGITYYATQRCDELKEVGQIDYKLIACENADSVTAGAAELKSWGAQAVLVYPQWRGLESPIQDLIYSGVKVISVNVVINCDGIYRISGDNEDIGRQNAKYIVDKIGTTGTVVAMDIPTAGSVAESRKKGFVETMAELAPDMEVKTFSTGFSRDESQRDFAKVLSDNAKIDAVFSMDDEVSLGILSALRESGRKDVKVVTGGGGLQEYLLQMSKNEELWIETAQYSPRMAIDAVDAAVSLLKGEDVPQLKILGTPPIDRTNCADFLNSNSPY